MALHTAALEGITSYTGLSPAAFFTILAAAVVVFKVVSSMFVSPDTVHRDNNSSTYVAREPVLLGDDVADEELRGYDGSDPDKPLLMAIKGRIYDVSRSRMFYGPGGPYALFAGRDASRALALMSFEPQDLTGNIEGLSSSELEVLQDWEYKFMEKYVEVGQLASARKQADPAENEDKISKTVEENGEQGKQVPASD